MTVMDPRFRDLDPAPEPLAPALVTARAGMATATRHFLSVPDSALEREWGWIGEGETDVRSGFYIAIQALQRAAGEAAGAAATAASGPRGPALAPLAFNIAARWDLHGVLAPLTDDLLDADPGNGEWTIRQTLAHTLDTQRAYAWFTAWWIGRGDDPDLPSHAPEELQEDLPAEDAHATGTLADIRARLDALVDLSAEVYRDATAEQLAVRARWSGFPVTAGVRLGRWGPHIEEHALQVDKTLVYLDRPPSEVHRLLRLVYRAMGRVEAEAWMLPRDTLTGPSGDALAAAASEVERIAGEVAAASR